MKRLVILLALLPCAYAAATPKNLIGLWAVDGQCGKASQQLRVKADTFQFSDQAPEAIRFFTHDAPNGDGAFHWVEEGNVSNIQYVEAEDELVSNPSGYGYPSNAIYERCSAR